MHALVVCIASVWSTRTVLCRFQNRPCMDATLVDCHFHGSHDQRCTPQCSARQNQVNLHLLLLHPYHPPYLRDVKPANVLLRLDAGLFAQLPIAVPACELAVVLSVAMLGDAGIAFTRGLVEAACTVAGTDGFRAPEVDGAAYDAKIDVYGAGGLLAMLL